MKKSDYQQFQRRNQQYQNQTMQNDLTRKLLQKQLQYQSLYEQYTQLLKSLQGTEEQNNRLKQTLKNLIPQNSWLKEAFQGVKTTLANLQTKEEDFMEQLNRKDQLIQELNAQIQKLGQRSEYRKSDMSGIGELANSLDEKNKLDEQIQKFKRERMIQNEKYEQKLQKKDQIIKRINAQSQQAELYYKQLLAKKTSLAQSLEQQLRNSKRTNQQLASQISKSGKNQQEYSEEICKLQDLCKGLNQDLERMKRQNQQLNSRNDQLNRANYQIQSQKQEIKRQNDLQVRVSTNISRQIQLKEQYIQLLEDSRKQLTNNQLQLQKTFSFVQSKDNQLKFKQQQLSQLRTNIANHQQYQAYLERSASDLQNDKNGLLKKLQEKDQSSRNLQDKLQQCYRQIERQRSVVQESYSQRPKTPNEKAKSTQHFYDCNNQKQLLEGQLRETKSRLEEQARKNQESLKQIKELSSSNGRLRCQLQREKADRNQQPSQSPVNEDANYKWQKQASQLRQERRRLEQRLSQKSERLQQKTKKLDKVQAQIRVQYQLRVKLLQKQIYRLTQQGLKQRNVGGPAMQNSGTLVDHLESEFQMSYQQGPQRGDSRRAINNQFDQINFKQLQQIYKDDSSSEKKSAYKQPDLRSKNSKHSEYDPALKAKYEQLRVQNDSLRAHLQRLSGSLTQNKQKLQISQSQNQKLIVTVQEIQTRTQTAEKRLKSVQRQLSQAKQQLQCYQSLKQLLKIQRRQSKQKSARIAQVQTRVSQLQKLYKQLKQDYDNLQSINEEINQKYKKTLQSFKKQMNDMNGQILKQKNNIEDKKKEMKRVENQYLGTITMYEDQNMTLKSKLKKQELHITKLQQRLKEVQQEQIQKVIITRTQLVNYKHTQKRLEDIQQQINSLLRDKEKIIAQKKSLEKYYEEQISLLKNNYSSQRQKILRRLTQTQEARSQYEFKLQKLKEILQKKRKQGIQIQGQIQRLGKQNYHVKLQLSEALSQTNVQLVKNKCYSQKFYNMQNQLQQLKMSYEKLLLQKSRNQKDKMTNNSVKVQLQMTYKQIQKLNDVLMQKQNKITYLLTQPTSDKRINRERYQGIYKDNASNFNCDNSSKYDYNDSFSYNYENSPDCNYQKLGDRKKSVQYNYGNEQSFGQSTPQPHYNPTRCDNTSYNDFVKQSNHKLYETKCKTSNYDNNHGIRKTPPKYHSIPQKNIGGFPSKYCTFAPEYHKI